MTHTSVLKFGCSAAAVFLLGMQANAINITFNPLPGAGFAFTGTGDTFKFAEAVSGFDFLTSASGDSILANGLKGNITGPFTIGTITTTVIPFVGSVQSAPLTPPVPGYALFSIDDGTLTLLTARIVFSGISTFNPAGSLTTSGTVNGTGFNLTNFSYSGSNAALIALASSTDASAIAQFGFSPAVPPVIDLTQLTTNGKFYTTSYTGQISSSATVPDSGSTVALLGMGLAGMEGLRRRLAARKSALA